ncbi:MAG: alpha/beta fold hydrolase, partial [Saprospiraceae bacterium]|nr:alpha/beta fold hydrolase [Saprospiraceae bacterium]
MKNLIFLHGALGAASQFDRFKELMPVGFSFHSFDFEGHGKSESLNEITIENLANQLANYCKNLNEYSIFGYSMGGYIALYATSTGLIHPKNIVTLGTKFDWTPQFAEKEVTMLDPGL